MSFLFKPTRNDDDAEYYDEPFVVGASNIAVTELDERTPTFTGILDANGVPILRIPTPKPPIGFVCPPEDLYLFDTDPEEDFYYSSDVE